MSRTTTAVISGVDLFTFIRGACLDTAKLYTDHALEAGAVPVEDPEFTANFLHQLKRSNRKEGCPNWS